MNNKKNAKNQGQTSNAQSSVTSNVTQQTLTAEQQASKSKYGTLTANMDVNNDYSSVSGKKEESLTAKQQASKSEYGTLTAKMDANNEYK